MNHFCRQEFAKASPFLEGTLKVLAEKYRKAATPLSIEDVVKIITVLNRSDVDGERAVYKNFLFDEFKREYSLKEKKQLMLAELHYKHPKIKHINLQLEETTEGWIIDVSKNPMLTEVWILQKLGPIYVKSLDLSGTKAGDLKGVFQHMQIEKLIIRDWNVENMDFLSKHRIKHLDAQGAKVDLSKHISNLPLATLNIADTPFKNWSVLKTLKFLKTLTISKNTLSPELKKDLSAKVEIIEI